jgi:hypothetical protein
MLFVGCSRCQSIGPYLCAGQFTPHMPMPAEPSPQGPFCRYCGPMAPMFVCGVCGTRQGLYMPGMPPPAPAGMGFAPLVAPVVQAPQGASATQVQGRMASVVRSAETALRIGDEVMDMFGAWGM